MQGDVRAAVGVEIGDNAGGRAHTAVVESLAGPFAAGRVIDVHAAVAAAEAGDDFVQAVAVEVGGDDGVAVGQGAIDHLPLPLRVGLPVDRDRVAVPGLDGGQEAGAGQPANGDVARSRLGPGGGIARGDFGAGPAPGAAVFKEMDARETGGENFVAAVAIPIHDVDAVDYAAVFGADELTLPLTRAIENQRRLVAIIGGLGFGAGEGRVDHYAVAAAVDIGGAQEVRSGQAIDFGDGPGLAGVAVVAQHGDDADAVFGLVGEFAGQDNVGDRVALHGNHGAVDHVGKAARDHVALPARILIPDEFGEAAGKGDEIGLAIVIEVGNRYLVAALEIGSDGVFGEARVRGRGPKWQCKEKEADRKHAPQVYFQHRTYEETVFVVDRGGCLRGGATGVFERHPATHARRAECRGVLVAGREAADFSEHAAAVPVRPDVHHECRWLRSAPGFNGQRGHHLRLLSERQPAHCLRFDAPGRRCLPHARGPQQGLRVGRVRRLRRFPRD